MSLAENIEKIIGNRYGVNAPKVSDREYNRIMRQLMCRLIDVEELFPGEYEYYDDVKDEYFRDFLRDEDDRDYSYAVETSRNDNYKLVVTDWSTDHRVDIVIKIPKFILEDGWVNDIEAQRAQKRINEIDKKIAYIEEIMASGTGQIMELNKEKEELEIKLRKLK